MISDKNVKFLKKNTFFYIMGFLLSELGAQKLGWQFTGRYSQLVDVQLVSLTSFTKFIERFFCLSVCIYETSHNNNPVDEITKHDLQMIWK